MVYVIEKEFRVSMNSLKVDGYFRSDGGYRNPLFVEAIRPPAYESVIFAGTALLKHGCSGCMTNMLLVAKRKVALQM